MIELEINVTWPVSLRLSTTIPYNLADVKIISPSKVEPEGDNRLKIDHTFGLGNRVCDDDRYRITRQDAGPLECCQPCGPNAPFGRTLVIVTESPHRSEYWNDCIDVPIGPAQGQTGHNIRDHLMSVLGSCRRISDRLDQKTRVIIANPIQFQTSLAAIVQVEDWRKIRNAVWPKLWCLPAIKKDFEDRLRSYGPDVVVNACTSSFKTRIHKFLEETLPCAHLYDANAHPAEWHKRECRSLSLARPILATDPPLLTGENLANAELTVILPRGVTFAHDADRSSFELVAPGIGGLSIGHVTGGASGTRCATLRLADSAGTGVTAPTTLAVKVRAAAHSGGRHRTSAALCVRPGRSV